MFNSKAPGRAAHPGYAPEDWKTQRGSQWLGLWNPVGVRYYLGYDPACASRRRALEFNRVAVQSVGRTSRRKSRLLRHHSGRSIALGILPYLDIRVPAQLAVAVLVNNAKAQASLPIRHVLVAMQMKGLDRRQLRKFLEHIDQGV